MFSTEAVICNDVNSANTIDPLDHALHREPARTLTLKRLQHSSGCLLVPAKRPVTQDVSRAESPRKHPDAHTRTTDTRRNTHATFVLNDRRLTASRHAASATRCNDLNDPVRGAPRTNHRHHCHSTPFKSPRSLYRRQLPAPGQGRPSSQAMLFVMVVVVMMPSSALVPRSSVGARRLDVARLLALVAHAFRRRLNRAVARQMADLAACRMVSGVEEMLGGGGDHAQL